MGIHPSFYADRWHLSRRWPRSCAQHAARRSRSMRSVLTSGTETAGKGAATPASGSISMSGVPPTQNAGKRSSKATRYAARRTDGSPASRRCTTSPLKSSSGCSRLKVADAPSVVAHEMVLASGSMSITITPAAHASVRAGSAFEVFSAGTATSWSALPKMIPPGCSPPLATSSGSASATDKTEKEPKGNLPLVGSPFAFRRRRT